MTSFAVLGSGGWGTAVACHLAAKSGHTVRLWAPRPDTATDLNRTRENVRQLRGVAIPEAVHITDDPVEATRDADVWVVAVPTAFLRPALARLAPYATSATTAVSLTKGIESETFLRPSDLVRELLGTDRVAVLSGPNHAEEIARKLPASAVVASADDQLAVTTQSQFGSDRFRVYTNADAVGVELAGALKNVLGIAAGMCDGLALGDNAKAALLTRGLVEMTRFGVAHGADPATFTGLAGMGDLIATCFSSHGRNRRVGERLAKGETLAAVTAGPTVAEGVNTARAVYHRATAMKLDVPIMAAVYRVLAEGQPPLAAMQDLLGRRQKAEGRY
jgi:glycerol-3-phosphate dehydrogenase (NAD(P)+)